MEVFKPGDSGDSSIEPQNPNLSDQLKGLSISNNQEEPGYQGGRAHRSKIPNYGAIIREFTSNRLAEHEELKEELNNENLIYIEDLGSKLTDILIQYQNYNMRMLKFGTRLN